MILLLLAVFSSAVPVPECDPHDPGKCSTHLLKGVNAPYTGQLLTTKLAISLGLKAGECDVRTDMEVRYAKREMQFDLDLERSLRDNANTNHELEMEVLIADRDRWKEHATIPFHNEPWFVSMVTAVVVGAVMIGSSHLIQATAPAR